MRHIDTSPLYRTSVGFDRLFSLLDSVTAENTAPSFPPYNIERTGENAYRITMAVAGFSETDLDIETKNTVLTVKGGKTDERKENVEVLHQGIAARSFERRFQLADHVEVVNATLELGLLHIDLVREIPEAMKPKKIEILKSNNSTLEIESKNLN